MKEFVESYEMAFPKSEYTVEQLQKMLWESTCNETMAYDEMRRLQKCLSDLNHEECLKHECSHHPELEDLE